MSESRKERRTVAFSRSVYEQLLTAYPKQFRELYGEEMVNLFEDECREQVESSGRSRLLWIWSRAFADLLGSAALERKRLSMSFSVVRWGGFLATAGGVLLAVSGFLMFWLLSGQTWSYAWDIAFVGQTVGMLLFAVSLAGLVALIAGRGDSGTSVRQEHSFSLRRFTRAQWSTIVGVFLIAVAVLAALGLLAVFLVYELVGVGGSTRGYPGDLEKFMYPTLGALVVFGIPLALTLLGIAVRRLRSMGRWSILPMGVGIVTFLIPLATTMIAHVFWRGVLPQSSSLGTFAMVAMPAIAIGATWVMLGITVMRSESGDQALAQASS